MSEKKIKNKEKNAGKVREKEKKKSEKKERKKTRKSQKKRRKKKERLKRREESRSLAPRFGLRHGILSLSLPYWNAAPHNTRCGDGWALSSAAVRGQGRAVPPCSASGRVRNLSVLFSVFCVFQFYFSSFFHSFSFFSSFPLSIFLFIMNPKRRKKRILYEGGRCQ